MSDDPMPTPDTPAEFLIHEAALLDDGRLEDWLGLLADDIDYRVPVRSIQEGGEGFSTTAFLYREDHLSIATRVARLLSDDAWAENPRTRTRRMVSNVRVAPDGGTGEVAVRSNLAMFCFRWDDPTPTIVTGERRDVLRPDPDGWRLVRRTVLLDATVLGLQSLSVFL